MMILNTLAKIFMFKSKITMYFYTDEMFYKSKTVEYINYEENFHISAI